jgi:hypothetical protein
VPLDDDEGAARAGDHPSGFAFVEDEEARVVDARGPGMAFTY